MKIRVDDVKKKRIDLTEEEPAEHYPTLMELEEAGEGTFTAPIRTELSAVWEYGHVRVAGKIETSVRLACSRCLDDYEIPISSDFTIFYSEAKGEVLDEEVELTDEELISASYTGDEIDVDPEIAEQVMLEVPYKPLCQESCKGLCPNCGANLNERDCGCDRGEINLKMAALKKLKIEK